MPNGPEDQQSPPDRDGQEGSPGPPDFVLALEQRPKSGPAWWPPVRRRLCWAALAVMLWLAWGNDQSRAAAPTLLPLVGVAVASALYALRRLPLPEAIVGLAIFTVGGFATGGMLTGCVYAAAVILGAAYPVLIGLDRGEDSQFFLGAAAYWLLLALLVLTVGEMATGQGVSALQEASRLADAEELKALEKVWRNMMELEADEPLPFPLRWFATDRLAFLFGYLLAVQSLFQYLALMWVRKIVGRLRNGEIRLAVFRIGPYYGLLIVAMLALFVLAPYVEAVRLQSIAIPLALWIAVAGFLSGLAILTTLAVWLRIVLGTPPMLVYAGIVAILLWASGLLVILGLTDVWVDWRRQLVRLQQRIEAKKREEGE